MEIPRLARDDNFNLSMGNKMPIRNNWTFIEISNLYNLPFMELLYRAQTVLRESFTPNTIQLSTLLNIKTGACPEDCAYCPQSVHYDTGVEKEKLFSLEEVIKTAKLAKEQGATRFCMGAAWKSPRQNDLAKVIEMIKAIKHLGLETCVTLGMLDEQQAQQLKAGGLDYYNHNLDTSREFYPEIVTTHTYDDRLNTVKNVRDAGIHVCCGGILGMGETREDRIKLLLELANMPQHPSSTTINKLIPIPGTPLQNNKNFDSFEFIRTIAVARIIMPKTRIRLSAGRDSMSDEMQAMCFFAGVNSIHYGLKLLTTKNNEPDHDQELLAKLGIKPIKELSEATL